MLFFIILMNLIFFYAVLGIGFYIYMMFFIYFLSFFLFVMFFFIFDGF